MEQEPSKHNHRTPQDRLRQLRERLEALLEDHKQVGRQADQLQGNPEYRSRLVVSQVKDNLARELIELMDDPDREPENFVPSQEMIEEGSSW